MLIIFPFFIFSQNKKNFNTFDRTFKERENFLINFTWFCNIFLLYNIFVSIYLIGIIEILTILLIDNKSLQINVNIDAKNLY